MGMALEEPEDGDATYRIDDITWALPTRDQHVLMGRGGLRVDHYEYEHGSYFHIARTGPGVLGC